jgi:hypothetical protein
MTSFPLWIMDCYINWNTDSLQSIQNIFQKSHDVKWWEIRDRVVTVMPGLQTGRSRVWIATRVRESSLVQKIHVDFTAHSFLYNRDRGHLTRDQSGKDMSLNTDLHLVRRLRTSGTISFLPLYVVMTCIATNLPLPLYVEWWNIDIFYIVKSNFFSELLHEVT